MPRLRAIQPVRPSRPPGRALLRTLAAVIGWIFLGAAPLYAQPSPTVEYQVKASYLYNFLQFVEWPPEAFQGDDIVLCVFGEDRFGAALRATAGETSRGRTIVIKHVETADTLEACHVVFLSSSKYQDEIKVLSRLAGRPVLTVGETQGFTRRGGIINLVPVANTIRFEINQSAAERNRLKVSAQLLQLAVRR